MNPELDRWLTVRYPQIFHRQDGNPRVPLEHWGFSCGDGWSTLLDTMCMLIMRAAPDMPPVALQVKEKYGVLSVSMHGGTERTRAYVEFAELMSESICERCGRPGTLLGNHDGGWLRVRCGTCDAEDGDKYLRG